MLPDVCIPVIMALAKVVLVVIRTCKKGIVRTKCCFWVRSGWRGNDNCDNNFLWLSLSVFDDIAAILPHAKHNLMSGKRMLELLDKWKLLKGIDTCKWNTYGWSNTQSWCTALSLLYFFSFSCSKFILCFIRSWSNYCVPHLWSTFFLLYSTYMYHFKVCPLVSLELILH